MHVRLFFILSLGLAALAVGCHLVGLSQYGRAGRAIAHAVTLPQSERMVARSEAETYRSRGTVIILVGLAFALSSVVSVIASVRMHEPGRRSVTVALLVLYVMLQFAVI